MNGDETPSKWDKIAKAPKDSQPFWYVFSVCFISSRLIFTKGISSSPVTDPFLTIADYLSVTKPSTSTFKTAKTSSVIFPIQLFHTKTVNF